MHRKYDINTAQNLPAADHRSIFILLQAHGAITTLFKSGWLAGQLVRKQVELNSRKCIMHVFKMIYFKGFLKSGGWGLAVVRKE